jgi:ABC-2 type transport system ATP-binding protein
VGSFCKFELAFLEPVEESAFADLPVYSLNIRGRFVQIVLEGDAEDLRCELEKLGPAVMDEMPLDFEEMFIYDVQKKGVGK